MIIVSCSLKSAITRMNKFGQDFVFEFSWIFSSFHYAVLISWKDSYSFCPLICFDQLERLILILSNDTKMKIRVSDQRLNENVLEKCDVQGISKFVRLCLQVLSRKACKTQIILFLAFVLFISSLLLFNYHKFHRHDGMVIENETCTIHTFQMKVKGVFHHIRKRFGRINIQHITMTVCEVDGISKRQKIIINIFCANGVNQKWRRENSN